MGVESDLDKENPDDLARESRGSHKTSVTEHTYSNPLSKGGNVSMGKGPNLPIRHRGTGRVS